MWCVDGNVELLHADDCIYKYIYILLLIEIDWISQASQKEKKTKSNKSSPLAEIAMIKELGIIS